MKVARDVSKNEKGYVIHNREIRKATVDRIVDISYHGTSNDVMYIKEIKRDYFHELYDLDEATITLKTMLLYDKEILKNQRKELKTQIKELKYKIKNLNSF